MRACSSSLILASTIAALCTVAEAQEIANPSSRNGVDGTGTVTDRDNTRVVGTVYDPNGKPLTDVTVWVANDDAPANRMRARARKTGAYMARGLGRLYTERNVQGINLRLSFEAEGRHSVEATVAVRKNELGRIDPILWPLDEEPAIEGVCMHLSGTVTGRRGKPVRGARVTLRPAGAGEALESVTGKDGSYALLLWNSAAEAELTVEAPGAEPIHRTITLEPSNRPDLVASARYDIPLGEG